MNKYHARKVQLGGLTFDSQAEAARWQELELLQRAGVISALRFHPRYVLQEAFTAAGGEHIRELSYEADSEYVEQGRMVTEDVKGVVTQEFAIKRKLFLRRYPGRELRIVKV
jgi:hypothetical protein